MTTDVTAQEEQGLLLRIVLKLAQGLLENTGELMPFGATLNAGREVQLLMPKNVKKDVTLQELRNYWRKQFQRAILSSNIKAVCHCADAGLRDEKGRIVKALVVNIEHLNGEAEIISYPYSRNSDGKLTFAEAVRKNDHPHMFTLPSER